MRTSLACLLACAACARPAPVAPPTPPAAPVAYLNPAAVGGSRDCLDPDSAIVRKALVAEHAPAELLDARALADDVRSFRGVLERQYAGYAELLQHPTFDVDRFFLDWESRLRAGPPKVSLHDGVLVPAVTLKSALGDRHLSVQGAYGFFAKHPDLAMNEFEAPDVDVDLATCARKGGPEPVLETLRRAPILGAARPALFVSARGPGETVTLRCGPADVVFARRAPPPKTKPPPVYEFRKAGAAGILVVGQLSGNAAERARLDRLAAEAPQHLEPKLLVIDLRHDGGGSDRYFSDWLARTAAATIADVPFVQGASAARCGPWNGAVATQIIDGDVDAPEAKAERGKILSWLRTKPPNPRPKVHVAPQVFAAPTPYRGRVFVLVDRESASSAEGSARMLAAALGATLVGERSGGYFEFGETTPVVMPRSGVAWIVPTKRWYPPQRIEGVGLPVDVYLPPELAAADAAELVPLLERLPPR